MMRFPQHECYGFGNCWTVRNNSLTRFQVTYHMTERILMSTQWRARRGGASSPRRRPKVARWTAPIVQLTDVTRPEVSSYLPPNSYQPPYPQEWKRRAGLSMSSPSSKDQDRIHRLAG